MSPVCTIPGTPNTWFAPVNASTHVAEPACEEPSTTYLGLGAEHGNIESPFLRAAVDPELSCSNTSSWDEASCRPGGISLGQFPVADAAACCARCGATPKCKAWVFRSDRKGHTNCWAKSSNSRLAKDPACTSAGTGPIHGPPPPPPARPPPPPQLYDVDADPSEHKDVAALPANKDVVTRLLARLNFYLSQRCGSASSCPCYGGLPTASATPSCPPCAGKNDSHVGHVVAPWC